MMNKAKDARKMRLFFVSLFVDTLLNKVWKLKWDSMNQFPYGFINTKKKELDLYLISNSA